MTLAEEKKFNDLVRAADALDRYLIEHPVKDFDIPDEIYSPFVMALEMAKSK